MIKLISDPSNLSLTCTVNGEVMQSSNTNQLVYSIEECIAWISKLFTIKPGDLLLTGTPPGVGVFRKPPIFLKVKLFYLINTQKKNDFRFCGIKLSALID